MLGRQRRHALLQLAHRGESGGHRLWHGALPRADAVCAAGVRSDAVRHPQRLGQLPRCRLLRPVLDVHPVLADPLEPLRVEHLDRLDVQMHRLGGAHIAQPLPRLVLCLGLCRVPHPRPRLVARAVHRLHLKRLEQDAVRVAQAWQRWPVIGIVHRQVELFRVRDRCERRRRLEHGRRLRRRGPHASAACRAAAARRNVARFGRRSLGLEAALDSKDVRKVVSPKVLLRDAGRDEARY
mmetsp:Transcript_204/g.506  ORF Transcript_204/g.506 Transcript_204/m.506 type:complete len:238 (+) Transcript_204:223-936(+)